MNMNRREFLTRSALAAGALATTPLQSLIAAPKPVLGKAEHCIFIWLGGGMSQIDTFDAKPTRGDGKKQAGCYYDIIDTAIPDAKFSEHLPKLAKLADRLVPVRTVNHNVIDEHAAATNRMHTGRLPSGSVVRDRTDAQRRVESRQRQLAALGQFEINGVVRSKIVLRG